MSYLTLALLVKKVFMTVLDGKWSRVKPSGFATLKTWFAATSPPAPTVF
jgi:hypothetical protein